MDRCTGRNDINEITYLEKGPKSLYNQWSWLLFTNIVYLFVTL